MVHPDFRSHTGAIIQYNGGKGAVISMSAKQKLNTASSTTDELVAVGQALPFILWKLLFIREQSYDVNTNNIVYQDNQTTIRLEKNGKQSSGKCTRALNIRYFHITNQVNNGNLKIKYFPTDQMIGVYMSKAVQGKKIKDFCTAIMGLEK